MINFMFVDMRGLKIFAVPSVVFSSLKKCGDIDLYKICICIHFYINSGYFMFIF